MGAAVSERDKNNTLYYNIKSNPAEGSIAIFKLEEGGSTSPTVSFKPLTDSPKNKTGLLTVTLSDGTIFQIDLLGNVVVSGEEVVRELAKTISITKVNDNEVLIKNLTENETTVTFVGMINKIEKRVDVKVGGLKSVKVKGVKF